jgi:hypothetical protein
LSKHIISILSIKSVMRLLFLHMPLRRAPKNVVLSPKYGSMHPEKKNSARRANNSFKINLLKAQSGSLC